MLRHLPIILVVSFAAIVIAVHFNAPSTGIMEPEQVEQSPPPVSKPNFAAMKSVKKRKAAFFQFLTPYVTQRNEEILALRKRIERDKVAQDELLALAKRYRIKSEEPDTIREQLLIKVDAVPPSLVLAQGAMESAWGTSRFAVEGNNYFGQWCFSAGCGLVPESRVEGKQHEVRVFESPQDSVVSYMRNLNSHPAYKDLRASRAAQREQGTQASGCHLALGLTHYSERGNAYVESLKSLIRVNHLEQDPKEYCAPVMVAEDEPEEDRKNPPTRANIDQDDAANPSTEIATDDSQGALPVVDNIAPPSS